MVNRRVQSPEDFSDFATVAATASPADFVTGERGIDVVKNNNNSNNNSPTHSCAKTLVEFVISADGKMCGTRLVYAAGSEDESVVAYESDAFRKWLMGK